MTVDAVKDTLEYARLKRRQSPFITLKVSGGKEENIPLDSILYMESRGHIVEVHTFSGMIVTDRSVGLNHMEKLLPQSQFLRTHRIYLVNLDHARKLDREIHAFVVKNGDRADIGRGMFCKCGKALKLRVIEKAERGDI